MRHYFNLWRGLIAYSASLVGTVLLANELARPWALLLLIAAAAVAIIAWGTQPWIPAFPNYAATRISRQAGNRVLYLSGIGVAFLVALIGGFGHLAAPKETFGLAGGLWLTSISLLLCSAFVGSQPRDRPNDLHLTAWTMWEAVTLVSLAIVALFTRILELTHFPDNIYPDEIMTGTIATQSYISDGGSGPSVFSTVWSGIDLPALWFWIVSLFLKLRGSTLATLRLPAALFGAATVFPLYGFIRGTWGKYAAIGGTAILAFSASNIHYSRLALNNITTEFFWAVCFYFLLRGLRFDRPLDWSLAGLSAGLSEYFYYGTRLLPFILILFVAYLVAFHWKHVRQCLTGYSVLIVSYFIGFGPLLFHFIWKPNLYFGRAASLMVWSPKIPHNFEDFGNTWKTVSSAFYQNLLGISTLGSQDIIYYAPLLLPAEAALLVLGVALILWHWRHPAAFLMLASGLGVLLIGGTLVAYPNSVPPLINHWTPAFPAFYVTLAVFIGAWVASATVELPPKTRWIVPGTLAIGLSLLGWSNLNFYFARYYADPLSLKSKAYRLAQETYEIQTAQSRYESSLGSGYDVFVVGTGSPPYDAATTSYLVVGQQRTRLPNPAVDIAAVAPRRKGLAVLFFPGNEDYRELTHKLYPGGVDNEVTTKRGKHLFYTYVLPLTPAETTDK